MVDSLKNALTEANPKEKFEINLAIFREYMQINLDTSSLYVEKAFDQAKLNSDSLEITIALNGKGYILKRRGDLRGAITHFEKALGIARRNSYRKQVKYLLNNLVMSYSANSSFDKALSLSFESLKMREEEGNAEDISVALTNIGLIYDDIDDNENALLYYQKSYDFKIQNHVSYDVERALSNISFVLVDLNRFDEAESRINQVFEICNKEGCRPDILTSAYLISGMLQLHKKNYLKSEECFNKSLRYAIEFELANPLVGAYYWLASLNYELEKKSEAIYFLNKGIEIAEKSEFQKELLDCYVLYSKIYSSLGNFKDAFYYQNLHNQLNAKILNGRLINKISAIQTNFKEQENKDKINAQAEIMKFQSESIDRQKLSNILIGIVALLTIGLSIVLYKIMRQKQLINKILDARIKERTNELEISRDKWKHSHNEQAIILERISNYLKCSLSTLRGLSIIAIKDLPSDKVVYFKEVEATTEGMVMYISKYVHGNTKYGEGNENSTPS